MSETYDRLSTENIYQVLRDRICLLEYPPGHRLRESTLADEFRVSRTPIRAVLQQLAHGGLIESKDGVGTLVTMPSRDEVIDIYHMRLQIAELIGKLSPRPVTDEHIDASAKLLGRAKQLDSAFELQEYWQINHDLHFLIAALIGNSALEHSWHHWYFQSARIWYQHALADSDTVVKMLVAELEGVETAMCERDVMALGYVQRNSIAYGLKKIEASDAV